MKAIRNEYRRISLLPSDATPAILYHYTTAAGLLGIVSNHNLRAGNFAYLNDATEITYGLEVVQSTLEGRISAASKTVGNVLRDVSQSLVDLGTQRDVFLACFCAKPDLLSQWRGYGSARGRFCIAFDEQSFPPPLAPRRVIYKRAEQEAAIRRIVGVAERAMSAGGGKEFVQSVTDALSDELAEELCAFKYHGFREEREWRIVQRASLVPIKFDASTGTLKPFVELFLGGAGQGGKVKRLPLREIIVGPSWSGPAAVDTVRRLLESTGYSRGIKVRPTGLSLQESS